MTTIGFVGILLGKAGFKVVWADKKTEPSVKALHKRLKDMFNATEAAIVTYSEDGTQLYVVISANIRNNDPVLKVIRSEMPDAWTFTLQTFEPNSNTNMYVIST